MGLAVEVGALVYLLEEDEEAAEFVQADFDNLNAILEQNNLPPHREPTSLPELQSRAGVTSFPYTCLHYLRRFYARFLDDPSWQPTPMSDPENPHDEQILDKWIGMHKYHLLSHSDCEGYYLPVDFQDIFYSDDSDLIPGNYLCSTYRLLEELVVLAKLLDIRLIDGKLSDEEAERINKIICESETDAFSTEKMVWLALFEACRLSVENKTAIWFC